MSFCSYPQMQFWFLLKSVTTCHQLPLLQSQLLNLPVWMRFMLTIMLYAPINLPLLVRSELSPSLNHWLAPHSWLFYASRLGLNSYIDTDKDDVSPGFFSHHIPWWLPCRGCHFRGVLIGIWYTLHIFQGLSFQLIWKN